MLLTAVVVVLGTAIFTWAVVSLNSYSQGISIMNTMAEERMVEDFVVEHAVLNETNRLVVYMRNVGEIEVIVDSIWVYNESGLVASVRFGWEGPVVRIGQLRAIDVRVDGVSWCRGGVYRVKVVSVRGNERMAVVRAG